MAQSAGPGPTGLPLVDTLRDQLSRAGQAGQGEERNAVAASAVRRRGLAEIDEMCHRIEALLAAPLFREVGRLDRAPGANQVLQKKEGYRQLLAAYIQTELAARLVWKPDEESFPAKAA